MGIGDLQAHVGRLKSPKKDAGGYLLFRETNWRSTGGLVKSALKLDELAAHIKALPVRQVNKPVIRSSRIGSFF